MFRNLFAHVMCAGLLALGCGEEVDEAGASRLWQKIHVQDYPRWQHAPGWESPRPSVRAHGDTAEIFMNPALGEALARTGLDAWPEGALVVKESQSGGSTAAVSALEKTNGAWFYAEWSAGGEAKYAGVPEVCTSCHDAGQDHLLSLTLP